MAQPVRHANEDNVLDLVGNLPEEAREAALSLAMGVRPQAAAIVAAPTSGEVIPFAHPDAPWEKWAAFLHPAQRAIVERDYSGLARVTGSAGTKKKRS